MDLITFFNINKTYSNKVWIYISDWQVLSLNKFKQLNNINFICGGTEYQIINNIVLRVG